VQLDDDVLASARVLARQRGESLGAVISELVRKGLHQPLPQSAGEASRRNELLCCRSGPKDPPWIWSL
jgi:hypothetical protein